MTTVRVDDRGAVRVLTLARPEVRNALDTATAAALLDHVAEAVASDEVRVLVLTGTGGTFSAGADLREVLDHAATVRRMEVLTGLFEAVATCPVPTIAAIEGACVGGGAELAAACDLRVADPGARFRFVAANLGYPLGAAKLVGLVGLGTAKDLVLSARTFGTEEALRIGFVQRLTPAGGALAGALGAAEEIAANHPEAVRHLKRQFAAFSGQGDRVAAENDALLALTEADGDYAAITPPVPGVGGWAGGWARP